MSSRRNTDDLRFIWGPSGDPEGGIPVTKKDWQIVGAVATVGGGIVAIHGITSKKWQNWHTFWTLVGIVAAMATLDS